MRLASSDVDEEGRLAADAAAAAPLRVVDRRRSLADDAGSASERRAFFLPFLDTDTDVVVETSGSGADGSGGSGSFECRRVERGLSDGPGDRRDSFDVRPLRTLVLADEPSPLAEVLAEVVALGLAESGACGGVGAVELGVCACGL